MSVFNRITTIQFLRRLIGIISFNGTFECKLNDLLSSEMIKMLILNKYFRNQRTQTAIDLVSSYLKGSR